MKKILWGAMLLALTIMALNAEVRMHSTLPEDPITDRPERPIYPERPVRPVVVPVPMYGINYNTYVTTSESNCDQYIEIIKEKDKEIQALLKEIDSLKNKEQIRKQKELKEEYNKQLKKFEERKK